MVIASKEKEVEKLVSQEGIETLKRIGLTPQIPPQITANRSIICRKVDVWVGSHDKEEMKEEIEKIMKA